LPIGKGETPLLSRRRMGMIFGLIIALVIPVVSLVVAFLWDRGVLVLGPKGSYPPLVAALFATSGWELVLGPVGIAVAGWSAGRRGVEGWRRLIIVAVPALVVIWFVAALYLSYVNAGTLI
jgi:hypothetical protein